MKQFTNLLEVEALAQAALEPSAFDYISGGASDEISLRRNRSDFDRYLLRPRYLVDVSNVDCATTVLGTPISMPVVVAPAAGHRMCCEEGELATAQAASAAGTLMVLSTLSTYNLEEVAAAAPGPKWFQLYVYQDREVTRMLVQRAKAAGYTGLCLTIDVPYIGNRERDVRNAYSFPYPLANFVGANLDMDKMRIGVKGDSSGLGNYIHSKWDPALTWKDVDWLASLSDLPVVVKGVLVGEDAALAVEHGAKAIIVSNHGGRQLDSVPSGIMALPEVVEAVDGRIEVLVDGGVRRGTDVLKALALGAQAVLLGRPYLYGLAVGGTEGATRVLELLRKEVVNSMALSGRPTIASIDRSLVMPAF